MLVLIGLLLVYLDIYIGSIDVIPDIIGYLLMIPGYFIAYKRGMLRKKTGSVFFLAALLHVLTLFIHTPFLVEAVLYFLEALAVFFLGLGLLKDLSSAEGASEEPWISRVQLTRASIWFILLTTVFSIPISALIPWVGTIFRVLAALCGLYVVSVLYRLDREFSL